MKMSGGIESWLDQALHHTCHHTYKTILRWPHAPASGRAGGTRTLTGVSSQRILSPQMSPTVAHVRFQQRPIYRRLATIAHTLAHANSPESLFCMPSGLPSPI